MKVWRIFFGNSGLFISDYNSAANFAAEILFLFFILGLFWVG